MRKVYREYSNGEIIVEWRSELCNHSGVCINGLPTVFNVLQIPWVDMKGAPTKEIIEVVDACPTRALAWRYVNSEKAPQVETEGEVDVTIIKDGPIVIKGNLRIKLENGEVIGRTGITSFCKCGLSKNMPYCDGAHSGSSGRR